MCLSEHTYTACEHTGHRWASLGDDGVRLFTVFSLSLIFVFYSERNLKKLYFVIKELARGTRWQCHDEAGLSHQRLTNPQPSENCLPIMEAGLTCEDLQADLRESRQ